MRDSTAKACLLLIALLLPAVIHAAGLGRLTVNSALGQPFKAEIDLVAVKKEEKPSLMARLASQDTFRQANVDYTPLLSKFATSIENRPDGQPYIRVTSSQPITEPFLNMLVELSWPSGRLLREYSVLLAPPETDAHSPTATPNQPNQPNQAIASDSANSAKAESAAVKKTGSPIRSSAIDEKALLPETSPINKTHTVYGPVKRGDTLAEIVQSIAVPSDKSINQTLVALHRANRDAFFGDNMNRLKTGPILRVPDDSEIGMITKAEADKEVKMQAMDWDRYRRAGIVGLTPVAGELKQMVTGKIGRNVEADSTAAKEASSEILRLSKSEEHDEPWNAGKNAGISGIREKNAGEKDGLATEVSVAQDRIRAMEEEAIARSKSLSESNERVALLEKNIEELRRLLELKNLALENMRNRVEAVEPHGAKPPTPSAADSLREGTTPEAVLAGKAPLTAKTGRAEEAEEATKTPLATAEPATEITKPLGVAEKSGHETDAVGKKRAKSSLIDDMSANIEYLGGALVLLITGIVGVSMIGRPKEASPDNCNEDTISSVPDSRIQGEVTPVAASEPVMASSAAETNKADWNTADWQEIVTKLDLARAYQEMGDKDAARRVLQEVMREGNAQQQESAGQMLTNL